MKILLIGIAIVIIGAFFVIQDLGYQTNTDPNAPDPNVDPDKFNWPDSGPPEDLTDIEITLERLGCFGTCPIYSVTIDGNGTVTYDGTRFVKTLGMQTYQIPQDSVEKLVELVYQKNYFSLNERYEARATDLPTIITTVRVGNETKTVENYGGAGPERLSEVERAIDELSDSESLWMK